MGVCTMEDERNWFVGVDWASETHHVRVSDARGRKLGARAFAHSGEGLAAMAAWILEVTGAAPEAVFVAIEGPHGGVSQTLAQAAGWAVAAPGYGAPGCVEGLKAANSRHRPLDPEVVALDALLQVFGDVMHRRARQKAVFPGCRDRGWVGPRAVRADPVRG